MTFDAKLFLDSLSPSSETSTPETTMPFKSDAQKKWMFANKPKMAKEWADHTPKGKKLPKKVKKAKKK